MRHLSLAAVLAALTTAAPALAQTYSVEPFQPAQQITIAGDGVRLRAEPSTATPVLSSGNSGLALSVTGIARQADWNWYRVVLRNGQTAYIRSDLTSAPSRGGFASIPEYGAPRAATQAAATTSAPRVAAPPVSTMPPAPSRQLPPAPVPRPYDPSRPIVPAPQAAPTPSPLASNTYTPPSPPRSSGAISLTPSSPVSTPNSDGLQSRPPGR